MRWMSDCGKSKVFASLWSASCSSLLVQREVTKRSAFPTAERLVKYEPDASRCDQAASVPCAPRVPGGRRTTCFTQTCAPVGPSARRDARSALRTLEVGCQEQKHCRTGRKAMLNDGSQERRYGGSCFCLSESPSAATEPAGKTRRATHMDVRRFSTRHGCRVEKSRRRSGPGARSASGAEARRAFFGPRFFARAKKRGSLMRSRSEGFCSERRRRRNKCASA